MKKILLPLLVVAISLMGCQQPDETSRIEVVKIDKNKVLELSQSPDIDSSYVKYSENNQAWSMEHYVIKPNKENVIIKDSIGNVLAMFKRIDGVNYEGSLYYPNGQLVGTTHYSAPGVVDGKSTYYYEDGRVKREGVWKATKKVGTWKNYNPKGKLTLIEEYDQEGELIHSKELK